MKTCKTCKYWKDERDDDISWIAQRSIYPVDPDTYEPMHMPFDVKKCCSPKICYFERTPFENGVTLCDGSEYFAVMITAEEFGCVNHEEES